MIGRVMRLGLVFAVAASALLVVAPSASAAFSNTPDQTWMTNGIVYAVTQSGNTIYVGGKFRALRRCPTGVTCPNGTISTVDVGAFDATTGEGISTFTVDVGVKGDGSKVYGLAVLDGKLYIGGNFSSVNGAPRLNMAAVDATTGALDPFAPQVGVDSTNYIRGMIAHQDEIYIAGKFASVNGVARQKLAAFTSAGDLDPNWRPKVSPGFARTFVPTCDGSELVVGGSFETAAGTSGAFQARKTLAIFDATTGALDPWTPDNAQIPNGVTAYDLAMIPTCDSVFAAYGGSNAIYRVDISDDFGDVIWGLHTGGNVQTVAVYGDRVLFGGHFANTPSAPNTSDKVKRVRFATTTFDGIALNDWTPEFDGKFFGPWDILTNEATNQVWVGGQFTLVSGTEQYFVARFSDVP
jgi:hypothetical protein